MGATSFVAEGLTPLLRESYDPVPFSRDRPIDRSEASGIRDWVSLVPIWALPDFFEMLSDCGASRIVALSSTSVHTRKMSQDPADRETARRLAESEQALVSWADRGNVTWLILRPTLIYGYGRDRNVGEIARFIARFGFFPILGKAEGLRQPVHADDVAAACRAALDARHLVRGSYDIAGAEVVSYREMVSRIFRALGRRERFLRVPLWIFGAAIAAARLLPRYRQLTPVMAWRMNRDMVFDCSSAARDFGFRSRAFTPDPLDLGIGSGSRVNSLNRRHAPVRS